MPRQPLLLAIAVTAPFGVSLASGDTITVCESGCDHTSINAAITAADDGDVIEVSAGIHAEGRVVDTAGKAVTIRGAIDAAGSPVTALDGGDRHRVLQCVNGEGATTRFENLQIRNGRHDFGAGMYNTGSSPTLVNCRFVDNSADTWGGGMNSEFGSSPILVDCRFTNNAAGLDGGGMDNYSRSNPTMTGCTFSGNSAIGNGGGLSNEASSPILVACTFRGNAAGGEGGGLNTYEGAPRLSGCLFCENTPDQVFGSWVDDGGNSISDPCCPEDLDDNGVVDGADLGLLLARWETDDPRADLDEDGRVDSTDLGLLLRAWGACA